MKDIESPPVNNSSQYTYFNAAIDNNMAIK